MKKALPLIALVFVVHIGLGYLYQVSNGIICLTELSFLAIGGILFWLALYRPLKQFTAHLIGADRLNNGSLLRLGGIGLLTSVLNLFFCQLFLVTTFSFLFNCESPSFNTLTASLTNNVAGNLLCYVALIASFVKDRDHSKPVEKFMQELPLLPPAHIVLQHQNAAVKVELDNISHVEVSHNAITIHTPTRKYVRYQSLKAFHQELSDPCFQRVHRSTLVNMNFVVEVKPNSNGDGTLLLNNGALIRFSRAYKSSLMDHLCPTAKK